MAEVTVPKKPAIDQLNREELIALVRELQRQIAELRQENERLRRSQHRQAAPFSKQRPVQNPKKPGRRKGKDRFGTARHPRYNRRKPWMRTRRPAARSVAVLWNRRVWNMRPRRMCPPSRSRK